MTLNIKLHMTYGAKPLSIILIKQMDILKNTVELNIQDYFTLMKNMR